MKQTIAILTLLAIANLASAQERIPQDEALKYAALAGADAKQLAGTPIPTDVDIKQPAAMKDGDYGGMVLPQKGLKAAALAKADAAVLPIGQLWLLKLTPMRDGEAVSSDKLRLATVTTDNDKVTVPQCALGVRRSSSGSLELLVYGKDKEPVLTTALKTIDAQQDLPIDMSAERESESGRITLKILGKYQATFSVTQLDL